MREPKRATAAFVMGFVMLLFGAACSHGSAAEGAAPTATASSAAPASAAPTSAAPTTGTSKTAAPTTPASSTVAATRTVDLAPVNGQGKPAAGWTVNTADVDPNNLVDCGDGPTQVSAAPAAITGDIYRCSPTAASADVCWPSATADQVLCLEDPWSRVLHAHEAQPWPLAPVSAPSAPAPVGLELANQVHCRLRNGGAWGTLGSEPVWVAYYGCGKVDLWAAPNSRSGGINRSAPGWTVSVGNDDGTGPATTVPVTTAYFVHTATG